jgi:hypothetical protein
MNSFSITQYEHQQIIDTYKQWLVGELYQNSYADNINDPNFLQKLSIIQAEGIRHDIALHAAATHNSIQGASNQMAKKLQYATSLITSSLDDGFSLMNQRMFELNGTLHLINANIIEGNRLQARTIQEIQSLNQNMVKALSAINSNISQATNILKYQLQQVSNVLKAILDELKIPESQRERRYHIEEGVKFFNMGLKTGDCLYFEDALDEFNTATSIERKDFFSWYYIGMIHLYSKNHIDTGKAISSFERYFHYAAALPQKHELFDDALIMKAECLYIEQNLNDAFQTIEGIFNSNIRASLRGVKYLSATKVAEKQMMAVSILKGLVEKNPYVFMQVLEDNDIINNDFIIRYIKEYHESVKKEVFQILSSYDDEMTILKKFPVSYYEEVLREIENIKSDVKNRIDLGVIDAIVLKEKLLALDMINIIRKATERTKTNYANDETRKRYIAEQKAAEKKLHQDRARLLSQGYVDLGLPSGKVWKCENERGSYNFDDAMRLYGNKVPSNDDWRELKDNCRWEWQSFIFNKGYKVIGPNGNSIFLPVNMHFSGGGGKGGAYISSSRHKYTKTDDDGDTYIEDSCGRLFFGSYFIEVSGISYRICSGLALRLAY